MGDCLAADDEDTSIVNPAAILGHHLGYLVFRCSDHRAHQVDEPADPDNWIFAPPLEQSVGVEDHPAADGEREGRLSVAYITGAYRRSRRKRHRDGVAGWVQEDWRWMTGIGPGSDPA